jgi:hypothetical protein
MDHILGFQEPYETYDPSKFFLYFYLGSAESARSILSTISGAMLGVAGTVFSITLVALTLASSQFGPRLLAQFHARPAEPGRIGHLHSHFYILLIGLYGPLSQVNDDHFRTPSFHPVCHRCDGGQYFFTHHFHPSYFNEAYRLIR